MAEGDPRVQMGTAECHPTQTINENLCGDVQEIQIPRPSSGPSGTESPEQAMALWML